MPIIFKNVDYIYDIGLPFEYFALSNINLDIKNGEIVAIVGHTGSGKSTLIKHFNGLLLPTSGSIEINGISVDKNGGDLRKLREQVGIVFQYPETQLFADTVFEDVGFGPKNMRLSKEEIELRVKEAILTAGLNYLRVKDLNPFILSGGEKRRVAIAGILAMKPPIIVFDEPTAGLDPAGKKDILKHISHLKEVYKSTIVIVTHNMEEVVEIAPRVLALYGGEIVFDGKTEDFFDNPELIFDIGLDLPPLGKLRETLKKNNCPVNFTSVNFKEASLELIKNIKEIYNRKRK